MNGPDDDSAQSLGVIRLLTGNFVDERASGRRRVRQQHARNERSLSTVGRSRPASFFTKCGRSLTTPGSRSKRSEIFFTHIKTVKSVQQ
jgi:hypothetical protein